MAKDKSKTSAGAPTNVPKESTTADTSGLPEQSTTAGVTDQTSVTVPSEPPTLPVTDPPPGEPPTDEIERLKKVILELEDQLKRTSATTITVNRAAFEKMMVALSMGHAENYISQACVVQVMALFELKTRDEGVKKLAELRQSHRDRVEKGA